jgi:hypothetical protein
VSSPNGGQTKSRETDPGCAKEIQVFATAQVVGRAYETLCLVNAQTSGLAGNKGNMAQGAHLENQRRFAKLFPKTELSTCIFCPSAVAALLRPPPPKPLS